MDWEKYNFKEVFSFRIRIALLLVLVVLILGFFFSPEIKIEREVVKTKEPPFIILPDPDEVVTVREIPKNDPNNILTKNESISEEPIDDEIDDRTDIPFIDPKNADVAFNIPPFVYYDSPPKAINLDEVEFEYPKSIRILGIEGTVNLELWIDEKGNVRKVIQIDSLHPALDKIAVENVWKVKFAPAMQGDKPVAVRATFPVRFKIE